MARSSATTTPGTFRCTAPHRRSTNANDAPSRTSPRVSPPGAVFWSATLPHVAKISAKKTEGTWTIRHGEVYAKPRANKLRRIEDLQYNNPYRYKIERVWFDGRVIFATEQGEVDVDPKKVKVAQEYQIVYGVKLT